MIKWLKKEHGIRPLVIFISGGVLVPEFEKEAEVFVWKSGVDRGDDNAKLTKLVTKVRSMIAQSIVGKRLKTKVKSFQPDLVYLSTVAVVHFVYNNKLFDSYRKVLHCHEMPYTINRYVKVDTRAKLSSSERIVVVNKLSRQYFIDIGVPAENILQVSEYFCRAMPDLVIEGNKGVFDIVSVGLGSWRKGIDLFIQIAYYFSKIFSAPFLFTWIGRIEPAVLMQLKYDIGKYGIADNVRFIGEVADPSDYIAKADVFLLTSREDPYPIVMMEAAWFEKSVLYFDGTGGASELVDDPTLAVPAFNVWEMANRIKLIAESPLVRKTKGSLLKKKVESCTIELVGKQIFDFVNS